MDVERPSPCQHVVSRGAHTHTHTHTHVCAEWIDTSAVLLACVHACQGVQTFAEEEEETRDTDNDGDGGGDGGGDGDIHHLPSSDVQAYVQCFGGRISGMQHLLYGSVRQ